MNTVGILSVLCDVTVFHVMPGLPLDQMEAMRHPIRRQLAPPLPAVFGTGAGAAAATFLRRKIT